jgi:hypothetical protein
LPRSAPFGYSCAAYRGHRFVRAVELSTLFVGTAAFSSLALVMDLTSSPDMIVRSVLTNMLLVYAVYVPSSARHTLVIAALMTVPLLSSIFLAFSAFPGLTRRKPQHLH